MIEAVLFDVDGTLIDSVDLHARAWHEALARWGHPIPVDEVRRQIGKGGDQLLRTFLAEPEVRRIEKEISDWRSDHFMQQYLPLVRPFPRVRAVIQAVLAAEKRIALASSAKREELDAYVRIAGVGDLLDTATHADDAERSKPSPDIFEAALRKLGKIPPERAIVIGDSPWDAKAATKLGLATIGLLCGGFPPRDLLDAGCIALYRDPAHLLDELLCSPIMLGVDGGARHPEWRELARLR